MRATLALAALLTLAACSSNSMPAGDAGAVPADAWMPVPVTCVDAVPTCPDGMDPLCWDQVQRPPTWRCDETGMCVWRSYAGGALWSVDCASGSATCPQSHESPGCMTRPVGE